MRRVGFDQGRFTDPQRPAWAGGGPRPVAWSVWYPAAAEAVTAPLGMPLASPLFWVGDVARGAAPATDSRRWPVVLLSHGTGGTAATLGWLACRLAAAGHVVIGVDHHGNTASEPYRPEAFICWWDRPADLTLALNHLAAEGPLAGRLDLDRVAAAGFSLGGYTVLSLAGAITVVARYRAFAADQPTLPGPREFPDIAAQVEPLLATSADFRDAWRRQSDSYRDARVKAVVALAPAPPVRAFTEESLTALGSLPVLIVTGEADTEAPFDACSVWLAGRLSHAQLHSLGPAVGHYPLLGEGTALGQRMMPELFRDPPGVDRRAIHDHVAERVLAAIAGALGVP